MSGYTAILLDEVLDGDTSEAIARILGRPIVGFYTTADGGGGGEYRPPADDANGIALDVAADLYRMAGSASAQVARSEAELLVWTTEGLAELGELCAKLQNAPNEDRNGVYDALTKVRQAVDELSFRLEAYDAAT